MEMKKRINLLLVVAVVALLVVCAFAVRIEAADSVALLRAQGMTCGSCAGKVESGLKKVKGVDTVEVDVAAGTVTVGYDSRMVKPEKLAEHVTAIGYGSSILKSCSVEEYKAMTGKTPTRAGKSGCGCCAKN